MAGVAAPPAVHEEAMEPMDVPPVMQPLLAQQADTSRRVQARRHRLAKALLVTGTAAFSGFATYLALRWFDGGRVDPIALVVLALLAAGLRGRWRAV